MIIVTYLGRSGPEHLKCQKRISDLYFLLFFVSEPEEADSDAVTPAALVIVTVALTVLFAGTEQFIDRVLLLD